MSKRRHPVHALFDLTELSAEEVAEIEAAPRAQAPKLARDALARLRALRADSPEGQTPPP